MDRLASLKSLIPYLKDHKKGLFYGLLFIIGTNIFSTVVPKVLGKGVDALNGTIDQSEVMILSFYIIGLALCAGLFRFLMRYTIIGISRKIEFEIRNEFFAQLQRQSQSYFDKNRTGDLMSRATSDLNAVRMVLGPGIMYSINTFLLFCFALTYMVRINPLLTLISLAPFPLLAYLINRFGTKIHFWFEQIQTQMASISAKAQENLSGIRIIKSYTREHHEVDSFKQLNREYVSLNRRLIRIQSLFFPVIQVLSGIGFVLVLWYGGRTVIKGMITIGDFVAFNTYLVLLIWPVIATGWVVNIFQRGAASMDRLNKILQSTTEIDDSIADYSITKIEGRIDLKELEFSYENGFPVLSEINISIPRGGTVAIIGPTGSGKSTLVNMIPRILDTPSGSVFIDGHDVRIIPLEVLRKSVGFVPQETFLFSDTIAENVKYGLSTADEAELEKAVEISQLKENIEEFPDKYETLLGERGINLSGGQKQRAAISRAVIREPAILILDDALSSVDTKTEEDILSGMKEVMKNRTSIIISHRVSTIKDADKIYMINEGRIVEEGTHGELLKHDGLYADLNKKQQLSEELGIPQ